MTTQTQPQTKTAQAPSLDSFIKNNRRFIKIKDGESFRAFFREHKVVREMSFGDEKNVVYYMLQEDGVDHPIAWKTASINVAEQMSKFSTGTELIITRKGATSTDTKYTIKAA